MKQIPVKPLDVLVIFLCAALTLLITASVYDSGASSLMVTIEGPDKTWVFPLEAEELVTVTGVMGVTLVELHAGKAAIVSSPCSGQTCVAAGGLYKDGQWAACLPNRVFLLVEGKGTDAVDAAAW